MTWLTALRQLLCRHTATYRERRTLGGIDVPHYVCEACGHAEPQVRRTLAEHAEVRRVGKPRTPKGRVVRQNVVRIETRRQA